YGNALGFERLSKLVTRNTTIEDFPPAPVEQPTEEKVFLPGSTVVRVRPNKSSKLDSNYSPEVFTVVAGFGNGTYQLADKFGRLLKRR
ncbi:hypothetical protein CLU79DRAFT_683271, partial [Phycomyces nitens]